MVDSNVAHGSISSDEVCALAIDMEEVCIRARYIKMHEHCVGK